MFLFGLLVSSVFFAHQPYAECASTPGSDGSMPKYVPQATKFRNLTPEEIVSYCNLVEADTKVTSVDAKSCSGRVGSRTGLRICQFKAMLRCNVNGYKGTTIRNVHVLVKSMIVVLSSIVWRTLRRFLVPSICG